MVMIKTFDGRLINADLVQEYRVTPQDYGDKYQLEGIFGWRATVDHKGRSQLDRTMLLSARQKCVNLC